MSEEQKQNKTGLLIVLIVSVGINAFFAFQIWNTALSPAAKAEKQANIELQVISEQLKLNRDSILIELEETKRRLDNQIMANQDLTSNNEVLADQVKTQYYKIRRILASSSSTNTAELAKARAELIKLQASEKEYLAQIGNLKSTLLNNSKELEEYKKNLLESLAQKEPEKLERQDFQEAKSELSISNVTIAGIRINRGQAQEVSKAKKVKFLKISYEIMPSNIGVKEDKKVQIKIVNSLGEVLNNDKDIQLKDADNIYTLEQSFLYEGKKMNESINYAHGSPLEPGKYAVEIIEKGKVIAIGDFLLK